MSFAPQIYAKSLQIIFEEAGWPLETRHLRLPRNSTLRHYVRRLPIVSQRIKDVTYIAPALFEA